MSYPQRIVCLAAEAPAMLDRLGAFDRIVAVSSFAREPEAVRHLPKVGGFTTPHIDKVVAMDPDLVITMSDMQADAAAALVRHGIPVLALTAHRLAHVWSNLRLVGGALGLGESAEEVVAAMQADLATLQRDLPHDRPQAQRPRVYFEEWHDPLISGIGWVSDLIEHCGGQDIFRELATSRLARDRRITADAVLDRRPDLIVASWCGKPAKLDAIRTRPGWADLPAVRHDAVVEIPSHRILQTGPGLLAGARELAAHIQKAAARTAISTVTSSAVSQQDKG